jgi:hypothetical protein
MRNLTQTLSIKGFQMRPLVDVVKKAIAVIKQMGGSRYEVPDDFGLVLGPELAANGGFDTSDGWSLGAGWVISGGVATATAATSGNAVFRASPDNCPSGKIYRVAFTVSGYSAGALCGRVGGVNGPNVTANGSYVQTITSNGSSVNLAVITTVTFTGTVDNISVREILSASAYIDSTGLVPVTAIGDLVGLELDSMRTLGPELMADGGFSTGIAGWSAQNAIAPTWTGSTLSSVTTSGGGGAWIDIPVTSGESYLVSARWLLASGGSLRVYTGGSFAVALSPLVDTTGAGSQSYIVRATTGSIRVYLRCPISSTQEYDDVSLRQITGNHATQATTANKPVVSLRPKKQGPEIIVDPEFDGTTLDAGWTTINSAVASLSGGQLTLTNGAAAEAIARWVFPTVEGAVYRLQVSGSLGVVFVTDIVSGVNILGNTTLAATIPLDITFRATSNSTRIGLRTNSQTLNTARVFQYCRLALVEEVTNVLRFDGTNDLLSLSKPVLSNASDHWVSAAFECRRSSNDAQAQVVFGCSSTASAIPLTCQLFVEQHQTTRAISAAWRGDNNSLIVLVGPVVPVGGLVIATAARIGNIGYLWHNGVLVASASLAGIGTTTCNTANIGATVRTTTSSYFAGDIYDLAYAQATLTESDRKTIEAAMAKKIAITL